MFDFLKKKPKFDFEVLDFNEIIKNEEVMSKLRRLTLCSYSGMNQELDLFENLIETRSIQAKAITAHHDNVMVAWALLSQEKSNFYFSSGNGFIPERDGVLFEVFVHPLYRRKGIATSLMILAKEEVGPLPFCVAPHDNASYAFYDANESFKHKRI
jgi:GNAT superfamily N-acetyltransferase